MLGNLYTILLFNIGYRKMIVVDDNRIYFKILDLLLKSAELLFF